MHAPARPRTYRNTREQELLGRFKSAGNNGAKPGAGQGVGSEGTAAPQGPTTAQQLGMENLDNDAPSIKTATSERTSSMQDYNDEVEDPFDSREVFDLIRTIMDPEHPNSLEELGVINLEHITVDDAACRVKVEFTPTIPHCSMATLIGLSIRVRLLRSIPRRFKVDVAIYPGTHASRDAVNKQLGDKERVAAALENAHLLEAVNNCIKECT
jgi:metal-sulfur cluster biosynthetic enzyme